MRYHVLHLVFPIPSRQNQVRQDGGGVLSVFTVAGPQLRAADEVLARENVWGRSAARTKERLLPPMKDLDWARRESGHQLSKGNTNGREQVLEF